MYSCFFFCHHYFRKLLCLLPQKLFLKFPGRERPCVIVALPVNTSGLEKGSFLLSGFHAFRNTVHIKISADADDIFHQHPADFVAGKVVNQRAVQLNGIEPDIAENGHIRIMGAEIIQVKVEAILPETVNQGRESCFLNIPGGFRDFQFNLLRRDFRKVAFDGKDGSQCGGIKQRKTGNIYGNGYGRKSALFQIGRASCRERV